eukprot:1480009-Rhodomonas_salina.7
MWDVVQKEINALSAATSQDDCQRLTNEEESNTNDMCPQDLNTIARIYNKLVQTLTKVESAIKHCEQNETVLDYTQEDAIQTLEWFITKWKHDVQCGTNLLPEYQLDFICEVENDIKTLLTN